MLTSDLLVSSRDRSKQKSAANMYHSRGGCWPKLVSDPMETSDSIFFYTLISLAYVWLSETHEELYLTACTVIINPPSVWILTSPPTAHVNIGEARQWRSSGGIREPVQSCINPKCFALTVSLTEHAWITRWCTRPSLPGVTSGSYYNRQPNNKASRERRHDGQPVWIGDIGRLHVNCVR